MQRPHPAQCAADWFGKTALSELVDGFDHEHHRRGDEFVLWLFFASVAVGPDHYVHIAVWIMSSRLIPDRRAGHPAFEGTPAAVVQLLAGELRSRGVPTRSLLAQASGHGAPHVLAITRRDLFAGSLNFVFGIASPRGACMVSAARLLARTDHAYRLADTDCKGEAHCWRRAAQLEARLP